MRRILAEPLAQFLAIGVLLFLFYALVAPADTGGDRIVVTREMIAALGEQHVRVTGRKPAEAELERLVERWVSDEIAYREGVAMGLDRDDAVIKRRVRQKFDLIAEEAASGSPTEAELEEFLASHLEQFTQPPRISFTQVIVEPEGSEAAIAARVETMLAALDAGSRPETVGRATLLPIRSIDTPMDRVAAEFGGAFASVLEGLREGHWHGPVASGYGLHLVRIDGRTPAVTPSLAEVRAAVEREWANERRVRGRAAREQALRARYTVVIETSS